MLQEHKNIGALEDLLHERGNVRIERRTEEEDDGTGKYTTYDGEISQQSRRHIKGIRVLLEPGTLPHDSTLVDSDAKCYCCYSARMKIMHDNELKLQRKNSNTRCLELREIVASTSSSHWHRAAQSAISV